MLCIGFCGGLNQVHENPFEIPRAFTHDGAAVLVEDGVVVAAIEEERLNRIKHSNKFPVNALRFCLERRGVRAQDIDCFAFYATEEYCNALLARIFLSRSEMKQQLDARTIMHQLLQRELGCSIDPGRLTFVRHHMAHAVSAYAMSGFEQSLVVAIDGYGDFLSGLVALGEGENLTEIETFPQNKSLGVLYLDVIQFLGYGSFDEYKVMGLAPYGNPATYRSILRGLYELKTDGGYELGLDRIAPGLMGKIQVRKKGQPFTQQHMDLAASLQEALEDIVLHMLSHRRRALGQKNLCLAGGVAHNCTMNGKILNSGLFDQMFVQPAAHDAGCALGAALLMCQQKGKPGKRTQLKHVFWGTDIANDDIAPTLEGWSRFLDFEKCGDIAQRTAHLIAQGYVIGWVQGQSEFGPRALGNRSILADPRPAENKGRINQMVKKREAYRPFAPSVLEEDLHEFFEVPAGTDSLPFMIFVVNVKDDKRGLLGAITHIDGTARVQTVSQEANPKYWQIIKAFKDLTGVPMLLNTSFNNNAEPIVDSVEDAIVSYLTTGLDYLIVGDYLVSKRRQTWEDRAGRLISLPRYARLHQTRHFVDADRMAVSCEVRSTADSQFRFGISNKLCELLMKLDGEKSIFDLFHDADVQSSNEKKDLMAELDELWSQRLIRLRPAAVLASAPVRTGAQTHTVGSQA
jgi:carbamoyltransferase